MEWATYTKRRKISLDSFIGELRELTEILSYFAKRGVTNPPIAEIENLLQLRKANEVQTNDAECFTYVKQASVKKVKNATAKRDNKDR